MAGPSPCAASSTTSRVVLTGSPAATASRSSAATGDRLETVLVAAPADDRPSVRLRHVDVPDVARAALSTAVDAAVDDDAAADARADLHDEHVLDGAGDPHLPEGHDVHVVVDVDRALVPAERAGDRVVVPARHDRRVRGASGRELHRPGTPTPTAHRGGGQSGVGEHLLRQPVDLRQDDAGTIGDVDRVTHGGEDLRREVGDRDVDARHAQIHGEHAARPAVELQERGRAPTGAPAPTPLLEEVGRDQLVDARAHRVSRRSRERHELGAAARAPVRTWRSSAPAEAEVCATPS